MFAIVDAPPESPSENAATTRVDPLASAASAAGAGDAAATATLLTAVGPVLLRAVRGVLGPAHPDVEDVLQEASIALLRALPTFRGECSVAHFAGRVATLAGMVARRRWQVRVRVHGDMPDDVGTIDGSPSTHALAARRRAILRALLDELPEPQAEALVLHCVLGHTTDEIAATAGAPLNTIRSRLRLAKEALRARIAADPHLRDALEVAG
jgi:RNA polymerase sigma factor (sigma-70 family)